MDLELIQHFSGKVTNDRFNGFAIDNQTPFDLQIRDVIIRPNSEVKFLRHYIEQGEHASAIANTAGFILENIFDFLTGIYQCRLPSNPGAKQRWTLDRYQGGLKGGKESIALALVEAICDEKDTLPDRRKDGCSWHNCGERVTCRLYPLLKPEQPASMRPSFIDNTPILL